MSEQGRPSVERNPLLAAPDRRSGRTLDRGVGASDDPILARLALWLADVSAEAPRAMQQPQERPIQPSRRKARA